MHNRLLALFVLSALFLSCARKENRFDLINRDTRCTIVLELGDFSSVQQAHAAYDSIDWFDNNSQPDDVCRNALAAREMQYHLSRMLGISPSNIPIIDDDHIPDSGALIFIGMPQHSDFAKIRKRVKKYWRKHKNAGSQDFRIDSFSTATHQGLVLSGHSSVGNLYAAYELLHRWGVRWISPEPQGEHIPHTDNISIHSLHVHGSPSFQQRGFWIDPERQDEPADSAFIAWMGRNRLNLFSQTQGNIGALKQRGILLNTGRRDVFSALLKPDYTYRYNHPRFRGDDHYPSDPYMVSDYYKGDINEDKKLSYAEAHPEWFGIESDTSDHQHVSDEFTHICLSYPEAAREFSQMIVDKLCYGDWRTCDIVDLWTPDIWCICEQCQQMGNDADKLLYLMYHVKSAIQNAKKDKKLNRPVWLHGYARNSATTPPSVSRPKEFRTQNSAVFLFTGPRCYNHFIIDTECTDINIWFIKDLLAWLNPKAIYKGHINVAENYNAKYFHYLPTVHSNIMAIDIAAYAELGVQSLNFQHVRFREMGVQRLTNYQFARQTWDVTVSTDTLKQEFFLLHYPGVSALVQDYYERIELAMSTVTTWRYYLPQRAYSTLKTIADSGTATVAINERFMPQTSDSPLNFNTLWENTYHLIFEARYVMNDLLAMELAEPVAQRIQELDKQLKYAELMVNVYDNIVTFFTVGMDEQYIREEAIFRLVENRDKLADYEIPSPIFGESNGLKTSGVEALIQQIVADNEP